jgi:hypothetical protein
VNKSHFGYGPSIGGIYQVIFNQAYFDNWDHAFVYIHPPHRMIYGTKIPSAMINPRNVSTLFHIYYKRLFVEFLPSPYETNCHHYRNNNQSYRRERKQKS